MPDRAWPAARMLRSIGTRMALTALLVGLLISALFSAAMLWQLWVEESRVAEQRLQEIDDAVLPALVLGLWTVDHARVSGLIDGIARIPGVTHVRLLGEEGEIWERGDPPASLLRQRSFALVHRDGGAFRLGELQVTIGTAKLREHLQGRALAMAVTASMALLGAVSLWLIVFRRAVHRHLVAMAAYARAMDATTLGRVLQLPRQARRDPDELDEVASALNRMRESLREELSVREAHEAELRAHRDHLESLVEQRTAELLQKNRELSEAHAQAAEARDAATREATRFADFAAVAADGFWETDPTLRLCYVSPGLARALGLAVDELLGCRPDQAYRKRYPQAIGVEDYLQPLQARQAFRDQLLVTLDAEGQRHWLLNQGRPIHGSDGDFLGYRGAIRDVTRQRLAEKALKANEERLRLIADNVPAAIAHLDIEQRYTFSNIGHDAWLGARPGDLLGRRIDECCRPAIWTQMRDHVAACYAGEAHPFEVQEGERYMRCNLLTQREARGVVGLYLLAFDITPIRRMEQEQYRLARDDLLTGLANRRRYEERLAEAIARSARSAQPFALLFMDLDRFKGINDTYGHQAGDTVLRAFAERVRHSVRDVDLVARLAGDEFVVMLEAAADAGVASLLARRVLAAMQLPVDLDGASIPMSTSIGIAVWRPGDDGKALQHRADQALYAAKAAGRGTFRVAELPV